MYPAIRRWAVLALSSMTALRGLSIAVLVALHEGLPMPVYSALFVATLFTHYILALGPLRDLPRKKPRQMALLLSAVIFGSAAAWALSDSLYNPNVPFLIFYFGIHLALTDAYSFVIAPSNWPGARDKWMVAGRFFFTFAVYLVLLHKLWPLKLFSEKAWIVFLFCAFGFYVWHWSRLAQGVRSWDALVFEALGLSAALFFFRTKIMFFDLVFYHLIFWIVYSVRQTSATGPREFRPLIGKMSVWTFVFLLFSPLSLAPLAQSIDFWCWMSNAFGLIHISVTFVTSRWNPSWLLALFKESRPVNG